MKNVSMPSETTSDRAGSPSRLLPASIAGSQAEAVSRSSGIDAAGAIPWGTHFCQLYTSEQELMELLVPYFKAGLDNGERCLWVTSPLLEVDEAWAQLARSAPDLQEHRQRGTLMIVPHAEWCAAGGTVDGDRALKELLGMLDAALAQGCAGLRVSWDTSWSQRRDAKSFLAHEAELDALISRSRLLVLCTRSLDRCGVAEVADLLRSHPFALLRRDGVWERIETLDRQRLVEAHRREREQAFLDSEARVQRKVGLVQSPEDAIELLRLEDVIEAESLQSLMEDFFSVSRMPIAIIDVHGEVLVGVGWQRICTKFHRAHPETCKRCVDSDTKLSQGIPPGEFRRYKCMNNMWDMATPIVVDGRHLGNLFTGQFFYTDDPVDIEAFKEQARLYGFDEGEYLAALDAVPRFTKAQVTAGTAFLAKLAQTLSRSGYANIRLMRAVAERETLLESLRQSRERLNRAQEIAHLGSWELDLVKNELSWSDEVYRIFGLQPQQFGATYQAFLESVHPDDRAAVDAAYTGSTAEGRTSYEIEHRVVRRSTGEVRWVHEKCEHQRDAIGRITCSVGMVLDITGRKEAEIALRKAKERLEEADRHKNQFLAVLSHELRNPLAPIKNSLFILDRAVPGSEQAQRAQAVIDRQVGQLVRLVDDLLDVTRISRNKIQLQSRRLELNELLQRTIEDLRSLFEGGGVQLDLVLAPTPVFVHGDRNRLAQLVGNLLHNAAKFTEPGARTMVSLAVESGQATIRVTDTGVGIPPDVLPRLGQPFMQADVSLDRSKGGLGLGLALVKGLVDLHGGEIRIHSDGVGKGTEVTVRLPLDGAEPRVAPHLSASACVPLSCKRVLVVEDNVDAANTLRDALQACGHEVHLAFDGTHALAAARTFKPDVVLCDLGLPGIDGYAVARLFRADPVLGQTFLVALSGYALSQDAQRAVEAGFDRHLAKPASLETLREIISVAPSGNPTVAALRRARS